jgi:hypothetical protein
VISRIPDRQEIIRVLKALAGRPLANPCQVHKFYGSAAFWPLVTTGFIRVVSRFMRRWRRSKDWLHDTPRGRS